MCTVSILRNCFNGEAYLEEAIGTVFSQTFRDWEIVFVDNCSSDRSAAIANGFGPKLKYYKTPKNVSLGEARAFGIDKCKGRYLMYLDVDDRYHQNTIDILLDEIKSSNYLVVYAGHRNIDFLGDVIGSYKPRPKSGNIFSNLLYQFDIPTVSLVMDLEKYKNLGHSYDKEVVVSTEYSHYLPLAVSNDFKCIKGEIADYRIHSGGLTVEKQAYSSQDRIDTLNKIVNKHPKILEIYPREFKEAFARADYYKARAHIAKRDLPSARRIMKNHIFLSVNYLAVYLTLFAPASVRDYIFKLKYSR